MKIEINLTIETMEQLARMLAPHLETALQQLAAGQAARPAAAAPQPEPPAVAPPAMSPPVNNAMRLRDECNRAGVDIMSKHPRRAAAVSDIIKEIAGVGRLVDVGPAELPRVLEALNNLRATL